MKLRQIHDLPNRTILAPEAMVYLSDQLADRQSKFTHSEKGPVEATRSEHVPPRTSETELDNLVHFRQHAQKAGLSERAANMAAKFLRIGTRDTYDSLLHRFYKWCREKQTDPALASLRTVAGFIIMLFDESISPQLEVTDQLLQLSIRALIKQRQSLTLYFFPLMRAFSCISHQLELCFLIGTCPLQGPQGTCYNAPLNRCITAPYSLYQLKLHFY